MKIIFEHLIGDEQVQEMKRKFRRFGYYHELQKLLGVALMKIGLKMVEHDMDKADEDVENSTPVDFAFPEENTRETSIQTLEVGTAKIAV